MADPKRCPKCGAECPADASEGLCPRCLMLNAMGEDSDVSASASGPEAMTASSSPGPGGQEVESVKSSTVAAAEATRDEHSATANPNQTTVPVKGGNGLSISWSAGAPISPGTFSSEA